MSDAAEFILVVNIPSPDCFVNARGDIDLHTAARFQDALLDALVVGPARLVVDLTEVDHIDESGVEVLVSARQRAYEHGTALTVKAASVAVLPVLRDNGFCRD